MKYDQKYHNFLRKNNPKKAVIYWLHTMVRHTRPKPIDTRIHFTYLYHLKSLECRCKEWGIRMERDVEFDIKEVMENEAQYDFYMKIKPDH